MADSRPFAVNIKAIFGIRDLLKPMVWAYHAWQYARRPVLPSCRRRHRVETVDLSTHFFLEYMLEYMYVSATKAIATHLGEICHEGTLRIERGRRALCLVGLRPADRGQLPHVRPNRRSRLHELIFG